MGTPRQILRLLAWTLLSVGLTASRQAVNIIPPLSKKPLISGVSPAHNGQVCSTWGNYHFKTFDGDVFQVPSTCNFVLSSLCKSDYEEFNIQMRRQVVNGLPTISKITMKLDGTVVELLKGSILINKAKVKLPFSRFGVLIEPTPTYIKITSKLGLVAMWNEDDSFLMEMDKKFKNQTCGLCGDFNGVQYYDEFLKDGAQLSVLDFANIWRMDSPTEDCEEPALLPIKNCKTAELKRACEQLLSGRAFSSCQDLVASDYLLKACISDLCHCDQSSSSFCLCNTISEYSRHTCSGGEWSCQDLECAGTCSVEGGSHITTFDGKAYSINGQCSFVLAKIISIQSNGAVLVNNIAPKLPLSTDQVTVFKPSTFYVIVQTSYGLQLRIQLVPVMQVYITLNPSNKGTTCGLCGNFNNVQADDFKSTSGLVEGTAAAFANTWKARASCTDVKRSFENPCSLSVDNEKYTTCPSTMVFAYSMTNCKRTCRSLSEPDYTCQVDFLPVDGCGCAKGTYMNQENQCVPPTSCPCYYKGAEVVPGETVIKNGATW
ncbi:hypothetical protein SKAU_G00315870 [Synaphobranchus kaupii]|uniref:VWFD domain-containing protein n=1 Tax=Synaphobranchus kaupii TaxID=118154 RepID=A0A9Q1ESJ5_SYNKA|nr:hypothetical protein SKAU_G00315870 [Synaphobranchus kaupii]